MPSPTGAWSYQDWVNKNGGNELNSAQKGILLLGGASQMSDDAFQKIGVPQPVSQQQLQEQSMGIVAGPRTMESLAAANAAQNAAAAAYQPTPYTPPAPAPANQGGFVIGGSSPSAGPAPSAGPSTSNTFGDQLRAAGNPSSAPANQGGFVIGGGGGSSQPARSPSAGLVSGSGFGYEAARQANTTPYNPTTRQVAGDELVENRVANLQNEDNPLMRRAAAMAREEANRRGLLNSSISVGAAQGAVLDRATDIAGRDAQTYTNVLDRNLEFENRGGELGSIQDFERAAFDANAQNRAAEVGADQRFDLQRLNDEYGLRNEQLSLQASLERESEMFDQGDALQRSYITAMSNLSTNYMNGWFRIQESDMTPEEKTAALGEYNTTIATQHEVLDLSYRSMPSWREDWGISFQQVQAGA